MAALAACRTGRKTRLSARLLEKAQTEGPQTITRSWLPSGPSLLVWSRTIATLVAHKPDFKSYLLGGPKVDGFVIVVAAATPAGISPL